MAQFKLKGASSDGGSRIKHQSGGSEDREIDMLRNGRASWRGKTEERSVGVYIQKPEETNSSGVQPWC
jgi:hypothetical protein